MCLSPTLVLNGVDRPVLPWQPDKSLIDSQERTLPCLDPHPFRKPLVQDVIPLWEPGVQTPSALLPQSQEPGIWAPSPTTPGS